MTAKKRLTVYYDGSCQVCSREMDYYRQRDRHRALNFIDIASPNFEAHLHGRRQQEFMARLHVRDVHGKYHTGVDAFAEIWRAIPGKGLKGLARLVQTPGIHAIASLGYEVFAFIRPWLPKREDECVGGHCHWRPPHSST